jgi:bifunctional non-homologous end joining protein LigD
MMSGIGEYRNKRDFSRTEEPEGEVRFEDSGHSFVIQKHAASRLHYDLRLELNGVLKSWAVPKGPSLDPAEKRLAVHVEDHPVEYGSFEGTIPRDQYGGGTVMVWDTGTWEPVGNPEKDYEKGKLTFHLHGKKLKGIWSIIRMKGDKGSDNWLLHKKRDDHAISEQKYRVIDEQSLSVLTGRSMEEITDGEDSRNEQSGEYKAGPDRIRKTAKKNRKAQSLEPSTLENARKAPYPDTFRPQSATLTDKPPDNQNWIHEIKFDGYRIVSMIDNGDIKMISRNGKNWTKRFASLAESLRKFPAEQAVLDGEIVVLRNDGTSDFQALQNVLKGYERGTLVYYAFDLPYCSGHDLTRTPLRERKRLLQSFLQQMDSENIPIRFSNHITGSGTGVYEHICRMALEGVISKKADSGYEQKRSGNWLKIKCLKRQEFIIGGYSEPSGSRSGIGALLVGYYKGKDLIYAGRVGTGFTVKMLRLLENRLKGMQQPKPSFNNPPAGSLARRVHWVQPDLVADVEFSEWTREGILRQPSFKGLREDKSPKEVVREISIRNPDVQEDDRQDTRPAYPTVKSSKDADIGGIRITNPDKILYAEQGVTKREIAEYYASIADHILPHVLRRPLSIVRCPHGWRQDCFFQRHITGKAPDAIREIPIVEKQKQEDWIIIDDIKGLIALVQLGTLEIHPWGSSEKDLEKPDTLTFDLDPGSGTQWRDVIRGAKLLHSMLGELGLVSFVKTSGGKGLHVVIPVQRTVNWDEAKAFTKAVAEEIVARHPDDYVATMSKVKRQGKIFIDYLRNGRGSTSVAAYSTRARSGAPVSTPIRWDELSGKISPDMYTIANMRRRLKALKKDPWEEFFEIRQTITKTMRKSIGMKT